MWTSSEELRGSVVLVGSDGTNYKPLANENVSPDARNLVSGLKPAMIGMLGPMGEHMEFVFFPSNSLDRKPIADAKAEGTFHFKIGDVAYNWRLPLGSLLPMKVCPTDGEELKSK